MSFGTDRGHVTCLKRQFPALRHRGELDGQDYQVPFTFTGKLGKLTLTIDWPQLTPADIEKLKTAQRNNHASE